MIVGLLKYCRYCQKLTKRECWLLVLLQNEKRRHNLKRKFNKKCDSHFLLNFHSDCVKRLMSLDNYFYKEMVYCMSV